MALGNEAGSGSGILEKFPAVCSLCKKATTVPFKPEPGRAVYCKDCIAKIKSGEVKVEKKGQDQIKFDETTFFKPLADLGIEFKQKDREENKNIPNKNTPPVAPKIFSTIKKVLAPAKNTGLKDVLNKALAEPVVPAPVKPAPIVTPTPEPVSLDSLKDKIKTITQTPVQTKDRSASQENMNKLKDLIASKSGQTEKIKTKEETPAPTPAPTPTPTSNTKEVPEDVLKKILE